VIAVALRTRRRLGKVTGPRPASRVDRLAAHPRITTTVAALGAGLAAGLNVGPVAALLASVYAALGYRAWLRIRRGRARSLDWTVALDALATAALLGVLPAAGIGLGYLMGSDPLRVLLHTPVGAGCALGAVAFQLAGLAWTDRLSRAPDGLA